MFRTHLTRSASLAWIALIAVVCILPLFKPRSATLFITYETAGEEFAAGRKLYDVPHPDTDNYRYSPLVAAGFVPFTLLPLGVGGSLWRILGIAIYLTGAWTWAKQIAPRVSPAVFFLLLLPLSIGSLNNGQANTHVLGLMLWGTVLAARGRWSFAAVLLAGATLFKGYPIALAGLFFIAAPLRFGIPFALAMTAGLLLPYALQTREYVTSQYKYWIENLGQDDRTEMPLYAGYQDFHMLLRVVGVNVPRDPYRLVQAAAGGAAAAVTFVQLLRRRDRRLVVLDALSLGICWMCLFGPSVETSTFILLAPILARELADATGRTRWMLASAWAGAVLFLVAIVMLGFPHAVHRPIIATGIQPLAALLISIAAVGRIVCRPAADTLTSNSA